MTEADKHSIDPTQPNTSHVHLSRQQLLKASRISSTLFTKYQPNLRIKYKLAGSPQAKVPLQNYEPHPASPPPRPSNINRAIALVGSIIGICVAIHVYPLSPLPSSQHAREILDTHFIHRATDLQNGKWYTYFTSGFMHLNFVHLGCNMVCLWTIGVPVAITFGSGAFLGVFFGSILAGGLAQDYSWKKGNKDLVGHPQAGIGASGGIFGLVSLLACYTPRQRILLWFVPMDLGTALAVSVVGSVACMRNGWLPTLGHADHLGGMVFGVLWFALSKRNMFSRLRLVLKRRPRWGKLEQALDFLDDLHMFMLTN